MKTLIGMNGQYFECEINQEPDQSIQSAVGRALANTMMTIPKPPLHNYSDLQDLGVRGSQLGLKWVYELGFNEDGNPTIKSVEIMYTDQITDPFLVEVPSGPIQ